MTRCRQSRGAGRITAAGRALVALALASAAGLVAQQGSAPATPPIVGGVAAPRAVRVQIASGKTAASLPVELPAGAAGSTLDYLVAAKAGQELRVSLTFSAKDPAVALAVACPGDGHTRIGRSGSLAGSLILPVTGDYVAAVTKLGPGPLLPGVLTVSVTGAPRLIAARPYTGTYYRQDGSHSSVDVEELGGARLKFSLTALHGALDAPFGPNLGFAHGTLELRDGVAIYEQGSCRLALRFGPAGAGDLHLEESGDCGFGHGVTAQGDYHRTSLCAAAEPPP